MTCNVVFTLVVHLGAPGRWRRLAGAERGSRFSQSRLDPRYERVRATEHASGGPVYLLERRHGLAEIVQRGGGVLVWRSKRDFVSADDDAYSDDEGTYDY